MEFALATSLVLVGAFAALAIRWALQNDRDPVSQLLDRRRSFMKDGILHVEGDLTPEERQSIVDEWNRKYPFSKRAF